ncbi:Transposable element tcb1 transposase, partial [Caligus rogercresseyi]
PKCQQRGLLDVMQTVVKPWMTQIAAGRPYLYQQDGAPAHTSNLVQNWCLENLDMFWSKEFWPPSNPDLNPCDYYLWGVLERDPNKRAHNTVDSLKAAIIQAVANLSREQ